MKIIFLLILRINYFFLFKIILMLSKNESGIFIFTFKKKREIINNNGMGRLIVGHGPTRLAMGRGIAQKILVSLSSPLHGLS